MTLSNITALSLFTDNAPASPAYFNAKWAEVGANFDSIAASTGTDFGQVTSGSTTSFPVDRSFILESYDSGGAYVNARALGMVGNGSTDDTAAYRAAITHVGGGVLYVPPGNYKLTSTVTFAEGQIKVVGGGGQGSTTFTSYHSGVVMDVAYGQVEFHNIAIEAASSTSTGYALGTAIRVSNQTSTSPNFKFLGGSIANIDTGIDFGADAGSGAVVAHCRIAPLSTTYPVEGIAIKTGRDTGARPRFFMGIQTGGGIVEMGGGQDQFWQGGFVRRVSHHTLDQLCSFIGMRYGNLGNPVALEGDSCAWISCFFSGTASLGTTATNSVVVGCNSTNGNVVNLSSAGSNHYLAHQTPYLTSTNSFAAAGYRFSSETALGWDRSASSTIASSYGTVDLSASHVKLSSTSSLIAAFVVQGSSSSFTIITWAAVKANDIVWATPTSLNGAVSSLSSGIVVHSHCTQNGQVELRLSNVSTLAQNVSTKTWFLTRITPF